MNMQGSAFLNDKLRYRLGCFFDTLIVAANTATAPLNTLFQSPISSSKGIEQTNMTDSGKLPFPISLKIMALRVCLVGMSQTDIETLYKKYCLRLKIGQKYFLEGPVNFFPGGGGISGAVTTTATTTTISPLANGVPDPRAVYGVGPEYALDLPSGVPFAVEMQGTSFTTSASGGGIHMQVFLDGLISEGVQ
jgi:hypothetical protein